MPIAYIVVRVCLASDIGLGVIVMITLIMFSHSSISRAFSARTLSRDDAVPYGDFAAAELARFNRKMAMHRALWCTTY